MRGLTLLETLIYLALCTLLITGVFDSTLAIQESSKRSLIHARMINEYLYLSDRLDADIELADSIVEPVPNTTSTSLILRTKSGYVHEHLSSSTLLKENGGVIENISDDEYTVTNLLFHTTPASTTPESVTTTGILQMYTGHSFMTLPFTHTTYFGL